MRLSLAIIVTSLIAAPVHAQSSITVYGLIDQALEWSNPTKNAANEQRGSSGWRVVNGVSNGSRFGIRGSEDLGGGLKAIFAIETRFDADTGEITGSRARPADPADPASGKLKFWNAQSWVGLDSQWGRLTAGRQYVPLFSGLANLDASGYRYYDHLSQFFNNRLDNALLYQTPAFRGLTIQVMYAFSGALAAPANTGATAYPQGKGDSRGAGARWDRGDFSLGGGYMDYGADKSGNALFSNRVEWGAGASYRFSRTGQIGLIYLVSNLGSGVTNIADDNPSGSISDLKVTTDFIILSGRIGLGSGSGMLYVNYAYKNPRSDTDLKSPNLLGITYDYPLTRRTDVYLALGNETHIKYAVPGASTSSYAYGSAQRVAFGLRHLF
jgi:predicted porin